MAVQNQIIIHDQRPSVEVTIFGKRPEPNQQQQQVNRSVMQYQQ